MANLKTGISWTDVTWSPLRGCSPVSPGCAHCYAADVAARFSGPGQPYAGLARQVATGGEWTGKVALIEDVLSQPLHWRKPQRVFVNSMSDIFHEAVPDEWIASIFVTMAMAQQHVFQLLTKRAERMYHWILRNDGEHASVLEAAGNADWIAADVLSGWPWPLPNVWLGISVENQRMADERIPWLLQTPAAVRFLSIEPLLGPVLIRWWLDGNHETGNRPDWVIIGGESGRQRRPMQLDWLLLLVEQCRAAGIPVFIKQDSALKPGQQGCIPDEIFALKQCPGGETTL